MAATVPTPPPNTTVPPTPGIDLENLCLKRGEHYETASTCFEALSKHRDEDLTTSVIHAEAVLKIENQIYPEEVHNLFQSIIGYDEPVYPIPVGASIFYFIMIAWLCTFYLTYLGRKIMSLIKTKLQLYPDPEKFPDLPVYWLQQSKREVNLRREVRNTWAWLAKRYLLSPNDPLLVNVDQVLGLVNWQDFDVCRSSWSLIKLVLRLNGLFVGIKRNDDERLRKYKIVKEKELSKIPVDGRTVQYVYDEDTFAKRYKKLTGKGVGSGSGSGSSTRINQKRKLKFKT